MAHRFMRLLGALGLVGSLSLLPIATVYACSCIQLGPGEALANSNVAFVGVVARVDRPTAGPVVSSADPVLYTFVVEEPLKGELSGEVLIVSSAADGASCGMAFNLGERWRLYAYFDPDHNLTTGLCSGNELMASGVPIPEIAAPETAPPPTAVLVAGAAALVLVGISVWAFTRPSRKREPGDGGSGAA